MARVFSTKSRSRLRGVHPDLVRVLEAALDISAQDFSILEGVRTPKRQADLYAQGRTKPGKIVTWTLKSNHFADPSDGYGRAVDFHPHPSDFEGPSAFPKHCAIIAAILAAAIALGVPVRFGADWDGDGKLGERGETDWGHVELAPRKGAIK